MEDIFHHNHRSDIPSIGAQVFIEPRQTAEDIDTWFRILHENQLHICRIRLFENYMRTPAAARGNPGGDMEPGIIENPFCYLTPKN